MKHFNTFLIFAMLLLFATELNAQTMSIYNIDASNYPIIKAEFKLRDTKNAEVRNFNANDIEVYENAVKRVVQSITCGAQDKSKFSAILTIDMSKSMDSLINYNPPSASTRLEAAKKAAKTFINNLPKDRFECAITVFSGGTPATYLKHDFSTDKNSLIDSVNTIVAQGGTDYNAGLMKDKVGSPGALEIAKRAKYKPIIIFLTDGNHNEQSSGGPFRSWDVINEANTINASIFAVTLGLMMPPDLAMVCQQTGGDSYSNITDTTEIVNIYLKILNDAGNMGLYPPCEIVWETDCKGGNVEFKAVGDVKVDTSSTYVIPDDIKPYLEVNPRTVSFINIKPSTNNEIPITITARKNFVNINSATCIDPRFIVSDWGGSIPFKLNKDQSRTIKIKYSANDSSYLPVNLNVDGSACDGLTLNPVSEWVVTPEIDMGSNLIYTQKSLPFNAVKNLTGVNLHIDKMYINGGDDSVFSLTNIAPKDLPFNNELSVSFNFKPGSVKTFQSNFIIETNKGIFTTIIKGKGTGEAGLASVASVVFSNSDCKIPTIDTTIIIKNSGTLALTISDMALSNTVDFAFNPKSAMPDIIEPGATDTVHVRFCPQSAGLKSEKLTITNNSRETPNYDIALSGARDSIEFSTSVQTIDFGIICPGEQKDTTITVLSTGSKDYLITGTLDSPFKIDQGSFTIKPSSPQSVVVSLKQDTEGDVSSVLTFTDEICHLERKIQLKGKIDGPKIEQLDIKMFSIVGVPKSEVFKICNKSARSIDIPNAFIPDDQFTIVSPNLPWHIGPDSCLDVTVNYLPTKNDTVNTYLELTGSPCNYNEKINLLGKPSLAISDMVIDNLSGLIGDTIGIPINMKNKMFVKGSKVTNVDLKISFNDDVLALADPQPPSTVLGGKRIVDLKLAIDTNNVADEVLYTLRVSAKSGGTNSTPITIESDSCIGGKISFNYTSGLFNVKVSSGDLVIGQCQAYPGEYFNMPVYLKNAANITSFHQGIKATLKFNASLMEPIESTPKGDVQNGIMTINLNDLPPTPAGIDSVLKTYKFRAMLGTEESTPITIEASEAKTGKIIFNNVAGTFKLGYVCESGGKRLFNPFGKPAAITGITPNPAQGIVDIALEISEKGLTTVSVRDMLGNNVMTIAETDLPQGSNHVYFDANILSDGVYFITMQTPTQFFTQKIEIIK